MLPDAWNHEHIFLDVTLIDQTESGSVDYGRGCTGQLSCRNIPHNGAPGILHNHFRRHWPTSGSLRTSRGRGQTFVVLTLVLFFLFAVRDLSVP